MSTWNQAIILTNADIDGLAQDCGDSIANTLELP